MLWICNHCAWIFNWTRQGEATRPKECPKCGEKFTDTEDVDSLEC